MRRLSKWAIVYHFAGQVVFAGFGLIIFTASSIILLSSDVGNMQLLTASLLGFAICLASIAYAVLWVHLFRYRLDDHEITIEKGVIAKSHDSIPYDRVQNIGIERSLLARILGISVIQIQTAGSHNDTEVAEGVLPGVRKDVAENLREEIIDRSRGSATSGGL